MGKKYAGFNTAGEIVAFYDSVDSPVPFGAQVIEISEAEWKTCLSTPGYTVHESALVAPAPPTDAQLLAAARAARVSDMSAACSEVIVSGFTSGALGTEHMYPSMLTDQTNQSTVAASSTGGYLWCCAGGEWSFEQHSRLQAQAVVADFATWLNKCQQQLADLIKRVNAANAIADVQAITWANPS